MREANCDYPVFVKKFLKCTMRRRHSFVVTPCHAPEFRRASVNDAEDSDIRSDEFKAVIGLRLVKDIAPALRDESNGFAQRLPESDANAANISGFYRL
ncbi:MAG TPA: hypothetical protein VK759_09440 [Rhizomicrobium sp.]|nr:hypothetical protein [Rhizomicrobium sp.]